MPVNFMPRSFTIVGSEMVCSLIKEKNTLKNIDTLVSGSVVKSAVVKSCNYDIDTAVGFHVPLKLTKK